MRKMKVWLFEGVRMKMKVWIEFYKWTDRDRSSKMACGWYRKVTFWAFGETHKWSEVGAALMPTCGVPMFDVAFAICLKYNEADPNNF